MSGPIDLIAREGFQYSIQIHDNFFGIIVIYLLRLKNFLLTTIKKVPIELRAVPILSGDMW